MVNAKISEKQLLNLYKEVKCLVCDGQSIAESGAEHAIILKEFIKEKANKGATEDDIKQYLVEKFGHEILFTPPHEDFYILLWLFPYLLLIIIIAWIYYRKKNIRKSNL